MLIQDSKGMYTIRFDPSRRICFEKQIGLWKGEDVVRFHNDYLTKIGPILQGKAWSKLTDLREYKTSSIMEELGVHANWMMENKIHSVAILVDSAIVKSQMNRAAAGAGGMKQMAFTEEKEASDWLKGNGF